MEQNGNENKNVMYQTQMELYRDIFCPPEKGCTIARAELTTWSLSKDMLRLIPAMILAVNKSKLVPDELKNPNQYIKNNKEELPFHIFYDGKNKREYEEPSYFAAPDGKYAAYIYNKYCTPVIIQNGLFHPKIILIQFKKSEGGSFFRVCISGKNLTFSDYIEAGVILESCPADDSDPQAGRALRDFFKGLYKGEPKVSDMLDELGNTHFKVKGCDAVPQIFFGTETNLLNEIKKAEKNYSSLRICSMDPTADLFPDAQYICNFKDMYDPQGDKWKRRNDKDSHFYLAPFGHSDQPKALHIKSYTFWNDEKVLTFIGSANCSVNGLCQKNEEVLVKFTTEKGGTKWFYNDPSNGAANFNGVTYCGYRPKEIKPLSIEDCDDEDMVFSFKVVIQNATYSHGKISFEITNQEKFDLTVRLSALEDGVEVKPFQTNTLTFKVAQSSFTNIILISDGRQWCSCLLDLKDNNGQSCGWQGKDYEDLKKALPEDEIRSIDDLLADPPEGVHFDKKDKAFEKIAKCRMALSDDDFKSYVEDSLDKIKAKKQASEDNTDDDEMAARLNYLFNTYTREVKELTEYMERMKGAAIINGAD